MNNKEFKNQELNEEQLDNLTNQVADGELSDEELENVDGGYWGGYFPNPYFYSTPQAFGQASMDAYWYRSAISDANHQSFIDYIRS